MNTPDSNIPFWLGVLALAQQAVRDPLTGLYNRRYFDETFIDHIEIATRYHRDLSLALIDLDDFKQINDTRGHDAGDNALRKFADLLRSNARKADIICRYGGDEFALLLPETNKKHALQIIERLKKLIPTDQASFTAGVAALPSHDLMAEADAALLQQKKCTHEETRR
ncbi:MAG: GGDEF domain-containing protein [Pontiellaceae bacterium]|nr:GGDEF domain-containing protein [Pontiellaceae bacterium]